MASHISLL